MNYHPKIDQSMNTAAKPVAPLPDDLVAAPGKKNRLWVVLVLALVALGATYWWLPDLPLPSSLTGASEVKTAEAPSQAPAKSTKAPLFRPTDSQWQTLSVETVAERPFRVMLATDGKIAIDEDHTTPVFSPYAGRILKLLAKAGDRIEQGAPLFMVEATDMVQGQNDFITARTALNKAASQLRVAEVILNRHRELLLGNAVSKRELEQAEIGQIAAVNDLKAAEVAFQAARNRLRILGKTDAEIAAFEQGGTRISAETTVMAPLSGTIVQRKVGPGQFVTGASNDPVFLIGDLSKVWLVANVRETDATKVKLDQHIEFTILAQPDKVYASQINYIASSVSPDTRRLQVRAEVANPDGVLRPEMFANVSLAVTDELNSPAVPRHAVIYEGENAHVWRVRPDKSIERRNLTIGTSWNGFVQVLSGLSAGDRIIGKGSLFIDRLAAPATESN